MESDLTKRHTIKQSLFVRAAMFTADELRRQRRLGLNDLNENTINGMVEQRKHFEDQQSKMVRAMSISLFLAFVSWSGGDIEIPGTGTSIGEVPAFLELSLVSAAFSVLMITYSFLSIQMYNAVISSIASHVLAKSELDPDLFVAAKAPTWLFIKYTQTEPVTGREAGYKISTCGKLYNALLLGALVFILLSGWLLAIGCIAYIAHTGLSGTIVGWSVYILCLAMIVTSLISMAANFMQFETELDFDFLEDAKLSEGYNDPVLVASLSANLPSDNV